MHINKTDRMRKNRNLIKINIFRKLNIIRILNIIVKKISFKQ